ncbi:arabinose efflux permease family protein [Sphaerochaeta pleomorpha str. Grapes]|uniref:Arabinose efflux permease family protein n=1 Tax=Sphaerochaeta pleomorpha (strain ATCC BAA-1885 / DSM 22778 / Grapes) TaxID=158190 RepID=G8QUC4_SPHPG|nr:MFS transporter [Sphaerochaeta pleomorpha]AEV28094.1 arabinose efflux permease family protein [Sphaerochaeta pleomorpha str. Grapes]
MNNGLLLSLFHFLNDGYLATLPLFLPFIQKDIGLSMYAVGLLGSILNASGIVLALPSVYVAKRFGMMKVLLACLLFYGGSFFIVASSNGLMLLLLAFIFAGIGFGVFHPVAFSSIVKEHSKTTGLGRKMGSFMAIGDLGRVGISSAVTFIIVFIGWKKTAVIFGCIPFLLFAVFYTSINHRNKEAVAVKKDSKTPYSLQYFKNKEFLKACSCSVIDALASSSLFLFLPFLFAGNGIPASFIGLFTSVFFIGNLLGKSLLGRVVDSFGQKRTFIICELAMALFLIALTLAKSIPFVLLFAFILGGLTKGTAPITSTMLANSVCESEGYEKAFGIHSFVVSIAATIAPLLLGTISSFYGISFVFIACAFFAILATIPAAFIKRH